MIYSAVTGFSMIDSAVMNFVVIIICLCGFGSCCSEFCCGRFYYRETCCDRLSVAGSVVTF